MTAKLLAFLGIALQLAGAWSLCRIFYRVNPLLPDRSRLYQDALDRSRWGRFWSFVGAVIFIAPRLPGESPAQDRDVVAHPNATFAFVLITLGALCFFASAALM